MSQDEGLADRVRDEEKEVVSGRSAATPFVVVGVTALTIAAVASVLIALVLLVFWLA